MCHPNSTQLAWRIDQIDLNATTRSDFMWLRIFCFHYPINTRLMYHPQIGLTIWNLFQLCMSSCMYMLAPETCIWCTFYRVRIILKTFFFQISYQSNAVEIDRDCCCILKNWRREPSALLRWLPQPGGGWCGTSSGSRSKKGSGFFWRFI